MDLLEKVFDADAQIFEDFIKRYSADLLPSTETFEYYTKGLQKQNPHFAICWSAVTAKTGDKYIEPIPRRRIVSENDDCQVFFDALFSVEAMQLLANRLVEHIGKPELTIGQLDELNLGYMELPVGCNKLRFSLHNLGDHDVDKSTKIVEFIDAINWEAYSHNRIFQIIESRVPMPSCTPDQIKYIQNWYYELEEKTDFEFLSQLYLKASKESNVPL